MAEYKISKEHKKPIIKKHILKIVPILIIAMIVGMGISFYQLNNSKIFFMIILPTLVICGLAVFIGLKFGLKIFRETHVDILIKIENNIFTLIKNGKEFISFNNEKINKIEQYKNKPITIFLNDKNKIVLTEELENYDKLINELNNIHEINIVENKKQNKWYYFLALIMLALMGIFYISGDRITTIITGSIIIIVLLISFIKIFFNKYTDKRLKLCMLVVFLVIFDIVQKILSIV
jgi:hypothetical protein